MILRGLTDGSAAEGIALRSASLAMRWINQAASHGGLFVQCMRSTLYMPLLTGITSSLKMFLMSVVLGPCRSYHLRIGPRGRWSYACSPESKRNQQFFVDWFGWLVSEGVSVRRQRARSGRNAECTTSGTSSARIQWILPQPHGWEQP